MSTKNKNKETDERHSKKNAKNDKNIHSLKEDIRKKHKKCYKIDMDRFSISDKVIDDEFCKKRTSKNDFQLDNIDYFFQAEMDRMTYTHENTVPLNLGYVIFDHTKYNLFFEKNLEHNAIGSHLYQLIMMSVQKNEFSANITYNFLMKADWSPTFKVSFTTFM